MQHHCNLWGVKNLCSSRIYNTLSLLVYMSPCLINGNCPFSAVFTSAGGLIAPRKADAGFGGPHGVMLLPPIGRRETTFRSSCSVCRTFPPCCCPRKDLSPQPTEEKSLLLPVEAPGRAKPVVSVVQLGEMNAFSTRWR